ADRDDILVGGEPLDLGEQGIVEVTGLMRVDANAGVDVGVGVGDLDGPSHGFGAAADMDAALDPGLAGASEGPPDVRTHRRVIEVTVTVDQTRDVRWLRPRLRCFAHGRRRVAYPVRMTGIGRTLIVSCAVASLAAASGACSSDDGRDKTTITTV